MEISKLGERSIKIKAKNTTFIVNPEGKIDGNIVVLTDQPADYLRFGENIVIADSGEYEISGVSIKGEKFAEGTSFDFFEDGQRLVILSQAQVAKSKDVEDATAVVTYFDEKNSDKISEIAAEIIAAVGPVESLPADRSNIKKADKLNLKKSEEYKGFIVHLSR